MAETHHTHMAAHLAALRLAIAEGEDAVQELERNGNKYLAVERSKVLQRARVACGHSPCPVADNYLGNAGPEA